MNTTELTQEEKNIKIAVALRWKPYMRPSPPLGRDVLVFLDPDGNKRGGCPYFFRSLDSMHEAEAILDSDQWHKYASLIGRHDYKLLLNATAEVKAECFGKAMGLW